MENEKIFEIFQITSRRSVGSYGDANSIASEEMSAFIADVTTKIPSDLVSSDSDDNDGANNEGDVETETEAVGERKSARKFAKKSNTKNSSNINLLNGPTKHVAAIHVVDDENDSGLQLSDN